MRVSAEIQLGVIGIDVTTQQKAPAGATLRRIVSSITFVNDRTADRSMFIVTDVK